MPICANPGPTCVPGSSSGQDSGNTSLGWELLTQPRYDQSRPPVGVVGKSRGGGGGLLGPTKLQPTPNLCHDDTHPGNSTTGHQHAGPARTSGDVKRQGGVGRQGVGLLQEKRDFLEAQVTHCDQAGGIQDLGSRGSRGRLRTGRLLSGP